jgi:hypothetical protein
MILIEMGFSKGEARDLAVALGLVLLQMSNLMEG